MKLYVLTQSCVADWPHTYPPMVTHDRGLAARTWMDWVVEALGYPEDDPDPEDVAMVRSIASQFIENDDPEHVLEWIVGNDGPTDEMVTYEVHVVDAPALQLIPILAKKGQR